MNVLSLLCRYGAHHTMTEPLDNPSTPGVDTDPPALWPPAGTVRDEEGNLIDGDSGDIIDESAPDPGAYEDPADEDPTPVLPPDAEDPLDDIPEGVDDGDTDLDDEGEAGDGRP